MMKFTHFASLALVAAALPMAGCSDGADTAEQGAEEANPTGLVITNARMMLPAVSGNPAAVYFDVENAGERSTAIRRADVEGAGRAEIHDTAEINGEMTMGEMGPVMIPVGGKDSFEPGAKHIMVFDLGPNLTAGTSTEMTLTVAGGKQITTDVAIEAAGEDR